MSIAGGGLLICLQNITVGHQVPRSSVKGLYAGEWNFPLSSSRHQSDPSNFVIDGFVVELLEARESSQVVIVVTAKGNVASVSTDVAQTDTKHIMSDDSLVVKRLDKGLGISNAER